MAFWYELIEAAMSRRPSFDDLRVVTALGQCLEHVGDVNRVVACPAEQELAKREIYCP